MKLTFLGATHEVTGSCYYLEACQKRLLIDYGMEQGVDFFENKPIPVPASQIDIVLLTHAHIDHSGLLPLLAKNGFTGQIFATEGTDRLCRIMLMDSAHIQEQEAQWKNRKAERAGRKMEDPLYTTEDAQAALDCFIGVRYGEKRRIAEGIEIRFVDAGHLLGSASIEVWITEDGVSRKLIFSGDIGNHDQPLINDPICPEGADYVVMESTYGDRLHDRPEDYDYPASLAQILQRTFDRGGNVVIPSFAVGRTQEILYFIRQIKESHLVHGHDGFEVYVDSPLAIEATQVFYERMYSDLDQEAEELLQQGVNPISFAGLRTAVTSEDSVAINSNPSPKVILSASGMCEAGRIRHHLKHNLWRPECTILFVGYQSVGTLGRKLVDGADEVKLFGEDIQVQAEICQLPGVSGHADREGLMDWIRTVKNDSENLRRVFVTHGEDSVCMLFADRVHQELGAETYAPYSGTVFDLANDVFEYEAEGVRLVKASETAAEGVLQREGSRIAGKLAGRRLSGKALSLFRLLLQAAEDLMALAESFEGRPNSEVKKFTKQIQDLCERWK